MQKKSDDLKSNRCQKEDLIEYTESKINLKEYLSEYKKFRYLNRHWLCNLSAIYYHYPS